MSDFAEFFNAGGRAPDVIVEERVASLTIAATFTDRQLNTVLRNKDSLASLASFAVTLPAGTYEYEIEVQYNLVSGGVWHHRLYNVTAAVLAGAGGVEFWPSGTNGPNGVSRLSGVLTLAAATALKLQGICNTTQSMSGAGAPGSNPACTARLKIWKVID